MKFTLELNEAQEALLEKLAKKLGLKKADLVRRSLRLLEVIVRETAEGKRSVRIVDADGQGMKELVLDLITNQ